MKSLSLWGGSGEGEESELHGGILQVAKLYQVESLATRMDSYSGKVKEYLRRQTKRDGKVRVSTRVLLLAKRAGFAKPFCAISRNTLVSIRQQRTYCNDFSDAAERASIERREMRHTHTPSFVRNSTAVVALFMHCDESRGKRILLFSYARARIAPLPPSPDFPLPPSFFVIHAAVGPH